MTTQQERINEALHILNVLGMPKEQRNERTAITLLALLNLPADTPWQQASHPLLGSKQRG
jgi:adenine-specific DNA-methyltransferase